MRGARELLSGALLALLPTWAFAQRAETESAPFAGVYTFVVENDLFGQRDRNYTSGVKASWMSPAGVEPAWARRIADATPPFADDLDVRFEFEGGQTLFTPEDLTLTTPDPADRPYAALTYLSFGMLADADGRTFDSLQLLAGAVGPVAQGRRTQEVVHEALGAVDPRGWDAQIPNRAVAALRYQRAVRLVALDGPVEFDLAPTYGLSLGNLQTYGAIGVNFRLGGNLPRDFGPSRVAPSAPGSGYFVPRAPWGWYLFGGVEARYTAYDVTLDERGDNGAKVTRKPQGGDAQLGLAVHLRDVRLAYTQVVRTREFRELQDDYSEFGALSVTFRR